MYDASSALNMRIRDVSVRVWSPQEGNANVAAVFNLGLPSNNLSARDSVNGLGVWDKTDVNGTRGRHPRHLGLGKQQWCSLRNTHSHSNAKCMAQAAGRDAQ